ncbi:MAG: ABC transporter permease [Endomicrobiia bacterium]
MKYTTFLAIKYLKPTKKKIFSYTSTLIAIFGIAIGVAALIVTLGIMTGFHKEIRTRLMKMYPHIIVTGLTDIPQEEILKLKEVESGSPFVYSQAIIKFNDTTYTTVVKGVNFELEEKVSGIKNIFVEKEKDGLQDKEIFLGKELAQNLSIKLNDEMDMIIPTQIQTPFGDLPMTEKFVVKGIFKSGIYEYDSNLCYINYDTAKKFFMIKKIILLTQC